MSTQIHIMGVSCALVVVCCLLLGAFAEIPEQRFSDGGLESDPESPVESISRSKRDLNSLGGKSKSNNSANHHVSNRTMVEILSNLNKSPTQSTRLAVAPATSSHKVAHKKSSHSGRPADEAVVVRVTRSSFGKISPHDATMGDLESLTKEEPDDLMTAAYDSKKYVLVKKKPKHKKIKMEVFEPKMKYKKIKMKVPVKKMKKKKVKGYLVKKEKHYH